jgi:hypothetical protein
LLRFALAQGDKRVYNLYIYTASPGRHDAWSRQSSRILTPARSASGRRAAGGKKRNDSQRRAMPARLVDRACVQRRRTRETK